ncbi:sarcosine oxidase subunit gamma [Falsihalocynthiibacter arcticus]|uniref:Sarcosine oxidase subunit gamma n=1 Tax=Falsihalocynthiibacter arcticus TaxID=1579316 RepID=A0A126V361_9RHOB|nr:sarcosine oxidase subunit gamma family protein [Falsihalocynthiibacter arcticus]AML52306.1 sarcosine oxidase subunit gamma [Falsihalocynthiibacter arcticus]
MSEAIEIAVSALEGATSTGCVTVREMALQGMLTVRADLSSKVVKAAVKALTQVAIPKPRRVSISKGAGVAWMSPDELLILLPYTKAVEASVALDKALAGTHALVENVSDARAVFTVSGPDARDVLAKLSPVDLSDDNFAKGEIRRSRLAQIPAAFWMSGDASARHEEMTIVVFRSVAKYAFDVLSNASSGGPVKFYS